MWLRTMSNMVAPALILPPLPSRCIGRSNFTKDNFFEMSEILFSPTATEKISSSCRILVG